MVRFLRNCDGGVAPLMALGAIPLVIGVGAAVDYSRGNAGRTAMQAALDAAAIMAAKQRHFGGSAHRRRAELLQRQFHAFRRQELAGQCE